MKNPDDLQHREFIDRYPAEAAALTSFDMTPAMFRDQFLMHVAKRLSRYFVDHPKPKTRMVQNEQ